MQINADSPTWAIVGGGFLALVVSVLVIVFVIVPVVQGVGWIVGRVFRLIGAEIGDAFRLIGQIVTGLVFGGLSAGNVLVGRWSRAQHYGNQFQGEVTAAFATLYRMAIGHPARLVGAQAMLEGLERRVPQAMAAAPPPTNSIAGSSRPGQFPGYEIIGTLPGGGSGGRLYVARPDRSKLAAFERQGFGAVGDVVVKSFSMNNGPQGSTLPQIVRENRALEAAKKLGLVLEHQLTNERFYYVMRYVPGDSLGLVTQRLHAAAGPALRGKELEAALGYVADLVGTLADYHRTGLWHKDVKPDNIIVSSGHAHLVDFGLVTPLRSSMTLTTHGTEYFRDPEMVRLALRGVKVHEVDGAKFDLYAAGAVLYSVIENSFPAHGGLSQINKPCPEAVRWIVRRAMTDYDKRYPSALAMLADLRVVLNAARAGQADGVRPADLPSVKDGDLVSVPPAGFAPEPSFHTLPPAVGRFAGPTGSAAATVVPPTGTRRTAREQLESARARVANRRDRAQMRLSRTGRMGTGVSKGTALGVFGFLTACVALGAIVIGVASYQSSDLSPVAVVNDGTRVSISNGRVVIDRPAKPGTPTPPTPPTSPSFGDAPRADWSKARADRAARRAGKPGESGSPVALVPDVGANATILVIQEPAGFDQPVLDSIHAELASLMALKFEVLGTALPAELAAHDETPEDTDAMAAELRKAVGLVSIPSDGASAVIRKWLAEHPHIDAVLWITRDSEAKESAGALRWLVAGEGLGTEQSDAVGRVITGR